MSKTIGSLLLTILLFGVTDVWASPAKDRVYELRSYESHTEQIAKNKIEMFNKGDEIGLFNSLGFNAVFYAKVITGSRMPNLMYLTTFENKADRNAHWKTFETDEYWKKLSSMLEYKNNVSKNDIKFLYVYCVPTSQAIERALKGC